MIGWCLGIACSLGYMLLSILYAVEGNDGGAIVMLVAAIAFFVMAWVEFARDLEN